MICILGPTASGKTALAVHVAGKVNGAIISADSRQVFKGMDIGTGKDLATYGTIDHYLIDILEPGDDYSVAHFQDDFYEAFLDILLKQKRPILCGGTGMYMQSVLQGYTHTSVPVNPELRVHLEKKDIEELEKFFLSIPKPDTYRADISTKKRLIRAIEVAQWSMHNKSPVGRTGIESVIFGLSLPLEERRRRITNRLEERLKAGMLDEVSALLKQGVPEEKLKFYGLEYKYATAYLLGEMDYTSFFEKLNTEIHRYAKRQMTYFRKMEKDGLRIHWLDATAPIKKNTEKILRSI
ncbi:tRNA (adenosine(37)-N6)-dimethylallyltransferase MiaA [Olivibacter sp. SDN3]|uniref:tRNA (adenosine(37)-N6)-dimethylallyltransferase MiaA n=1 Tax=Olivibacter sp. SDN3 TaxID=2764720 RepID=UPI001651B090|nr:tRNA (adenosine(37)-N6)-dimethylallyltransferase MiaA [Olivibacter sp. SDN3]QNL51408.1 tRNA (adenosine(37)-N6)-dimethylallyltransferase MiaA [Olivibacter sp. SDN3]